VALARDVPAGRADRRTSAMGARGGEILQSMSDPTPPNAHDEEGVSTREP
jgi:hypothetical protein